MQVLRDPDRDTALRFLQEELAGLAQRRGHMVQAVGECEVKYQGRARSVMALGERLVLLKPDGTLLIHNASKAKPVNWQPPGATFSVAVQEGRLVLTSHRLKPEELVQVTFEKVAMLLSLPLRDGAELSLLGSEDDLQQLLYQQPQLVEIGFVPRRRERGSEMGFYDLDGDDSEGRRLVVEVKRGTAGVSEAQQLWRYVERLRKSNGAVRGMLVAPTVAPKARTLLAEHGLEWKELDWSRLLPKVEAMRAGGQANLARFGQVPLKPG